MPAPSTSRALLELLRKGGLASADLEAFLTRQPLPPAAQAAADVLIDAGLLTRFQARLLLAGKYRGFLLGPYRVLEPIGKGGMGAVYLAEHTTTGGRFAVKVLPPERAEEPATLQRFYREARAVAALNHPNIIRAYEIAQAGDIHYFVMEYVRGKNLEDLIKERGPLPFREAVGLALQAAQGLQHAHERGLVHRDIKPANLLLEEGGTVKVLDMGLARFFSDPNDDLTRRLSDESVLGTADYIAPEQALDSHEADIRADIYSLGGTLYALVHGHPPFGGKTISQKLMAHQLKPLKPLHEVVPGVPEELSAVVARMMAKKPEERYQTPAEVIEALKPWAPPRTEGRRFARGLGRWRVAAIAAAALVLVSLGAWWLSGSRSGAAAHKPADPPAKEPPADKPAGRVDRPEGARVAPVPAAHRVDVRPDHLLAGHAALANEVALSADGSRAVSAGFDGTLRVWDVRAGKLVSSLKTGRECRACALSADGKRALSGEGEGPVRLWDVDGRRELLTLPGHRGGTWAVAFTPDGRHALSGGHDRLVVLWSLDTGKPVRRYEGHTTRVWTVAVSPDGGTVAAGAGSLGSLDAPDNAIRLWEVSTGRQLDPCLGHEADVRRVAFSPDGKTLASAGFDGSVRLWDVASSRQLQRFDAHKGFAECVRFLSDDRLLSAGGPPGGDGSANFVKLWDLKLGQEAHAWRGHGGAITSLAVADRAGRSSGHPGGRTARRGGHLVLSSCKDGSVRVWHLSEATPR
jgi:tRNA A-37 threonylcarbamoyl transferase component Bud32